MNLTQLKHFVALAEHGSFTRAAERSHVSQPALSRSVALLEEELGMPLVDRIGRRNELTAFGRSALDHARHVLFEVAELERDAGLQQAGIAGQLRIGLGSSPSSLLMAPLLTHIARSYPALSATLTRGPISQQVQALRLRTLDALVVEMHSVAPTPDLHIERLIDLRVGWLCRRGHPLARRKRLGFEALRAWPIASTQASEEAARALVNAYGPTAHPAECVKLCCEDIASLLDTVSQSDAIYVGVLAPARRQIDSRMLVELPVRPLLDGSRFALVRLGGRSVPPAYAMLRDFVRQRLRD